MEKCPHCGAETRPGDKFCLSCGNRLLAATPSAYQQQAQPAMSGDATLPAQDEWLPPAQSGQTAPAAGGSGGNWGADPHAPTVSAAPELPPTVRGDNNAAGPAPNKIEQPAHVILKAENGEVLKEYILDQPEISIGRAPNSDILLQKDKLTSRRHATIRYENGQYILRDERSANGTFINGQQLEEMSDRVLQDGDIIGIGEHELIFRANPSAVSDLPTVSINPAEMTARTKTDTDLTAPPVDGYDTNVEEDSGAPAEAQPAESQPLIPETPEPPAPAEFSAPANAPAEPSSSFVEEQPAGSPAPDGITFSRLTSLPQPSLPDMSSLMAALATLDGQVSQLQQQLNETQEAMRNHEAEIAQTTAQLRAGVRRVSDHMDNTIAEVARSREALAWSELLQLMDDVTNNPRDIEYVTKLARKARELNKVFQIHQSVLNTLAECNTLLRALIGEER